MVCSKDEKREENAVIIELKQWDACEQADGENEVLTWVGGVAEGTDSKKRLIRRCETLVTLELK